jgi:peptidoglycan LD-endopeptidase LytH
VTVPPPRRHAIAIFVTDALASSPDVRRLLTLPFLVALALLLGASFAGADEGDLDEARERAQQAAQELADAESRLGIVGQEITDLELRAGDAQRRLDELRGTVQDAAVSQFINRGAEKLSFVEDDLNRQARADALSRYVTQGNTDAIEEFTAATEDLEAASSELAERRAEQEAAVTDLKEKRSQLDAELARLEEIERQRIAEEQRRAAEAERRRQAEEARRIEAAERAAAAAREAAATTTTTAATTTTEAGDDPTTTTAAPTTTDATTTTAAPTTTTSPPPTTQPAPSGGWICPVQGPHTFIDSWGAPRSGGRYHQGVDMMASSGTPTVAPVSGTVEHRGNSLGGLSWYLWGDDGHYYYGTHLSAYANVGAGHVSAGTVIGYVGDTGNAAGNPHLHFEIHPNGGGPVNPYPTVAQHCR